MADTKISGLTSLAGASTASGDLLTIVDVSDTTMAASGTNKKITLNELQNATVSSGTANGILYLNGSKITTSGSVLTFDGSALYVAPDANRSFKLKAYGTYSMSLENPSSNSDASIQFKTNNYFVWSQGATDSMLLSSAGNLGIGTTSVTEKLNVVNSGSYAAVRVSNGTNSSLFGYANADGNYNTLAKAGDAIVRGAVGVSIEGSNGAGGMRLDSSGNLGLGVTPSAWGGIFKSIDISGTSVSGTTGGALVQAGNAYFNGSAWVYKANGSATRVELNAGAAGAVWYNAASGTAGNAITWTQAMTLDASGRLGIGNTSPANPLDVFSSVEWLASFVRDLPTDAGMRIGADTSGSYLDTIGVHNLRFFTNATERARIDSSGNLLVGGTSNALSSRVLAENGSGNQVGIRYTGIATYYLNTTSTGAFAINQDGTERARIDSSGNLLVGTTTASGVLTVSKSSGTSDTARFQQPSTTTGGYCIKTNAGSNAGTYYHAEFQAETTAVGSIYSSGTTTTYATSSDYRLKTVTGAVSGSGARIDLLEPVEYTWNSDGSIARGFLAHKFQEVYPSSVSGTKDAIDAEGNPVYQTMQASTSEVIADLVAELQSLRKRLADAGIA